MFKSLVVLGSLFAGYVSGAPAPVTPVTVVYDTVTDQSNVCDDLTAIFAGGATIAVLGWYTPDGTTAAVVANSALDLWNQEPTDTSARAACAAGLTLSMGVKYSAYSNANTALVGACSTYAGTSGIQSLYWDVEDMTTCVQADVDFIAGSLVASTIPIFLSVPAKYFSTKGPCGASISLEGAIETAYGVSPADVTKLAGIVVQYYNSGADFSTLDSMFVKAPTAAAGSAIAELSNAGTNLKNKFIAGKLMKTIDNPDTTKPGSDFTDLVTLDTIVCQARNFDGYANGITLYKYANGDATPMAAFATDCTGITTSSTAAPPVGSSTTAPTTPTTTTTKASGSAATLMISSVAVAAGLAAIMN